MIPLFYFLNIGPLDRPKTVPNLQSENQTEPKSKSSITKQPLSESQVPESFILHTQAKIENQEPIFATIKLFSNELQAANERHSKKMKAIGVIAGIAMALFLILAITAFIWKTTGLDKLRPYKLASKQDKKTSRSSLNAQEEEIPMEEMQPIIEQPLQLINEGEVQIPKTKPSVMTIIKTLAHMSVDIILNLVVPIVDEYSDIHNGIILLIDGELFYGTLSLGFLFFPAIFASVPDIIAKRGCKTAGKTFLSQLPGVQIGTHFNKLKAIFHMKNDLQSILNQANQTNDKQEKKSLEQHASNLQLEIEGVKSSLQSFKIFAGMCESTPQLILQCSLSMKKNPKDWFEKIFQEPRTAIQFISSILSVIASISGLITQIPFLVGNTLKTPLHSKILTFALVAPFVCAGVVPRIWGFSLISTTFVYNVVSNWQLLYYAGFILTYFVLHCSGTLKILKRTRSTISNVDEETSKVLDEHFVLAMIPSIMSPYGICVLGSSYLSLTACLTSIVQCLAIGTNALIATYVPHLVRESNESDEMFQDKIHLIQWHSIILIPLLLISNLWFFIIEKLVHVYNSVYNPLLALKKKDEDSLESILEGRKHNLNLPIPGDKFQRSLLLIGTTIQIQ